MVRVVARRVDGGALEVAIQRQVGGTWDAAVFPELRFVPVDAPAGRWLESSPLVVEPVGEVRVAARRAEDGRTEFAVQQHVRGVWGERLLPPRRWFPAGARAETGPRRCGWPITERCTLGATVGAWLETGPLQLEAPARACLLDPDSGVGPVAGSGMFEARSFDGYGNNFNHPSWGAAGATLLKLAPNSYADGISVPTMRRPNARRISNAVFAQTDSVPNAAGASDITWQWGQFIDHDITLSLDNLDEPLPILVPRDDEVFGAESSGRAVIGMHRSVSDAATGTDPRNPRRQINSVTSFIDGSMVYGSDSERAHALRANDGTGRLASSHGGRLLPYNTQGLENEGGSDRPNLFVAGDLRVNEQIGLISMHTLFVREHNRLAGLIARADPALSGDEIYELARKLVGAQIQAVTFNEFLPLLLGADAVGTHPGYNPNLDPTIASEFSAAAYRVGHTLLSPSLLLVDADGSTSRMSLAESFFTPGFVAEHGISRILRGLATQPAQHVDSLVIDEVRNFLLRAPGGPAFDLVALNIQRGRDHGLGDYNTVRGAYGLPAVESFADITSDPATQQALQAVYGTVHDLDLWPAALAEDHVPGASVGETLRAIIGDQFGRLRAGDRFWYESDPWIVANPALLAELRGTTLAGILRCNTPIGRAIGNNAFIVNDN